MKSAPRRILAAAINQLCLLFGGIAAMKMLLMLWPNSTPSEPGYSLRPATEEDQTFLREVHHEALKPAVVGTWGIWDEGQQDAFVDEWLERAFPQIIERKGRACGYLEVAEAPGDLQLINVVLAATVRGRGMGTAIVRSLQEKAAGSGRALTLHVLRGNPRAKRFYERLGFVVVESMEKRFKMSWSAFPGGASVKEATEDPNA